jgi:hypothetical protein
MNDITENHAGLIISGTPSQTRPLGEDLSPPRPLYFTYLPLILALTGVLAWVTGVEYSTVIGSFVGGAVSCYMLWDWLIKGGDTRFTSLIAMGLLMGYGLGAFNTWATTSRGSLTLGQFTGNDDAVLARGIAAVLISCAIAIFIGELFERPVFGRDFRIQIDDRMYVLIYLGTLLMTGAFATGALSLSGATGESGTGNLGVVKAFILWFFSPLVTLTVTMFLLTPRRSPRKILTGICAGMLLMFTIVMGRRIMIYTVMEIIFLTRLGGVKLRGSFSKKLLIFTMVGLFVVIGGLGFMLLRIAGYGAGPRSYRSLSQRLVIVSEWVSQGTAYEKALTSTQSNVKTRTFVLGFFANVLEGSSEHTPGLGGDAVGQLQLSIPSAIYPGKNKYFTEEALVDQLFGFSYGDEANSLITQGATDLGLLGVILSPLIMAWLMRTVIEFTSWRLNQGAALLVLLAAIFVAIQTEETLTGYVNTLLYGLIFSVGFVIFFSLPRIRLRN